MADVSIKEVARLAGVSIATVSRCINRPENVSRKTRQRVQNAIATTGYAPNSLAQSFRRGRSNTIIVFAPSIDDTGLASIISSICQTAAANAYAVMLENTALGAMAVADVLLRVRSQSAAGAILLSGVAAKLADRTHVESTPMIPMVAAFATYAAPNSGVSCIQIDNAAAAEDATRHLIASGHERIGLITGPDCADFAVQREKGFRAALSAAELAIADDWIVDGGLSIDGARHATRRILASSTRPSAMLCTTGEMAIGCLHECKSLGLTVPLNISVVGIGNSRYAEICDPPLTTVDLFEQQIGEHAVTRLIQEIESDGSVLDPLRPLPHQLVERHSVATWTEGI